MQIHDLIVYQVRTIHGCHLFRDSTFFTQTAERCGLSYLVGNGTHVPKNP
jgi:hypothetical protein